MYLHSVDATAWSGDHGRDAALISPVPELPPLPFGAMWSVLGPGAASDPERHHESEIFFVVQGRGLARVGPETRPVAAGDSVYVPPFVEHSFVNTADGQVLRYVSLWWEDGPVLRRVADRPEAADQASAPRRTLITATPPTVNGELHLGHISGPYLAADICRRYLAMREHPVLFVTGSDENQSYVVTKARQKGWTPRQTADQFGDDVQRSLAVLDIEPDVFARPSTSPDHTRLCREFFERLYAAGRLERRTAPALYCDACDRYLFEAHVSGTCPHCGHASDGCACEDCARPNDCVDLIDPRCAECGDTPAIRDVERLYFPLSRYREQLTAYVASVTMPPHLRALCESMLADGLPDVAVTHVASWGIEVPVDELVGQVVYVWFEMCPGYLAATRQADPTQGWEQAWRDPDAEIVQFFGFDNGYFHTLLFPALLMAYDPGIRLPSTFVTNEFYLLDGEKFSSSREHAIWAREFAAREPVDWIRFYLALDRPENRRTNMSVADYRATVDRELAEAWPRWLGALERRVVEEFGGTAPGTAPYSAAHARFFRRLTRLIQDMEEALGTTTFSPPDAARVLCELVRSASDFGSAEAALVGVGGRQRETAVALELAAARTLATLAAPVLPRMASRLWRALGFEGSGPSQWESTVAFVPSGQDVNGLSALALW